MSQRTTTKKGQTHLNRILFTIKGFNFRAVSKDLSTNLIATTKQRDNTYRLCCNGPLDASCLSRVEKKRSTREESRGVDCWKVVVE